MKLISKNGTEQRLPGLQQYTPEQMFWIAAAQTWCSIDRSEYMRLRILNGVHAPDKYRVIIFFIVSLASFNLFWTLFSFFPLLSFLR